MNVRAVLLWAPVVVYMGAIFWVSSLPLPPVPVGGDKPWHLIAYGGLGSLWFARSRADSGVASRRASQLLAVGIAVAYAVTDEVHQMYVPGRSAELADLLADTLGVVAGTGACWVWGLLNSRGTRHKAEVRPRSDA